MKSLNSGPLSLKDSNLGVGGEGWDGGLEERGGSCEPVPNLSLGESAVHRPPPPTPAGKQGWEGQG